MSKSSWYSLVVDCNDIEKVASFWQAVLDWTRVHQTDDEIAIAATAAKDEPLLLFGTVPEGKAGKNRLHIDLAPDDRDAEVARIIALGATHADVGQTGDEDWVVLADPEGNEFCVLSAR